MYTCEICNRVFENSRKLNGHKAWHSSEPRKKSRIRSEKMSQFNKIRWNSKESREKLSLAMKVAVDKHPHIYSKFGARSKIYSIYNSGELVKVRGRWEFIVANWLNENQIQWTNKLRGIKYQWNDNEHTYFPDFLLTDLNIFIEVKGYQTERDLAKWKNFSNLVVLKKNEIQRILNSDFSIQDIIAGCCNGNIRVS